MQPIVLRIANSEGVGDYTDGLSPNITLIENRSSPGMLGESSETLFASAIQQITGSSKIDYIFDYYSMGPKIKSPSMILDQSVLVDKELFFIQL